MEHPFDRLASDLARRHGPSVLREPVQRVIEEIGDTPAASVLRALGTASGETLLGPLLEDDRARRRFRERLGPVEQGALVTELRRWSRGRDRDGDAEDRRDSRKAADVAEHELVAWARRVGVEQHLDDPASEIASFVEGGSSLVDSVRYLASGQVRDAALARIGIRGSSPHELAHAARRYLEACAADAAQHARREMLWRREPSQPALARISGALLALEDSIASKTPSAARIGADALVLDASVPCLRLKPGPGAPRPEGDLRIVLTGHERGEIAIEPRPFPPRRALALVRAALDAVHDPMHALHAALADSLGTPAWRRLLESMEESLASGEDEAPSRLSFRVAASADGAPIVDIAHQRRGARGRWSKGSKVTPAVALAQHRVGPAEALALRALEGELRPTGAAEALFALAGSSSVSSAESGAPLEVRRVEARFAFADEAGGVRPSLALGDARIPVELAAKRIVDASCVAHVLPERGLVLVAPLEPELAQLVLAAARHSAVVPDAERASILPLVERVAARVPVTLSPALEAEVEALEPALFVRITPDQEGASLEIRTRLSPSTSAIAGEGATLVSLLAEGTAAPVLRRRDLAREVAAADALARELHMTEGETRAHLSTEDAVMSLLAALHARPDVDVEWPADVPRGRYVGSIGRAGLRVSVKSAAEWFGVDGEVEIDGEVVKLADLLAQVRAGRRFVRLPRGRFAVIESDLRARLERAADVVFQASGRGSELAVVPAAGDALEALVDEGALRADEQWKRIRARLTSGTLADAEVPPELRATLRDYQRTGFVWLARLASLESGAVLADDMGLGKTVQALALLVHRASEGPALVIAPTSLGDNWAREAERFAPSLRVRVHRGGGRHATLESEPPGPGDVLVASYDVVALDVDALSSIELATLVLDEAQSVKNPEALRTKAVRELRARVRVALTGTPLENRLSELWSIISIVHPGLLGPWEHFRARFAQPIERDHDAERLAALAALVRPYLLRRTKEVVTPELPPRIEILREVELSDAERRLYDAERTAAIASLGEAGEAQRFRVLASITRLRELACDASLVVPDARVTSSKLAALIDLVDELESAGRKVLVFSQFVRLLERVADLLRARETTYLQLDGSTPAAERARRVERFQRGEATVFLLSLKAGGTGLNLTTADTVVHLDPWWNPAVEDQASDRAHRIGQDKPVTIVRLVAKDTIEQAVLALHDSKRALTRGVLEGADAAGTLSAVDLLDLIRTLPGK